MEKKSFVQQNHNIKNSVRARSNFVNAKCNFVKNSKVSLALGAVVQLFFSGECILSAIFFPKTSFSPNMTKVGPSQFFVAENWSKNRQEKVKKKIHAEKKAGPEAP